MPDREVLEHICYDQNDTAMLDMLKPCIEEAFVVQDREVRFSFFFLTGQRIVLSIFCECLAQ